MTEYNAFIYWQALSFSYSLFHSLHLMNRPLLKSSVLWRPESQWLIYDMIQCMVLGAPGLLIYDISPCIYGLSLRSTYLWKTNVKSYMELHKQILVVCHINIIRSVILSWWAKQNDSFMILNIVPPQSTLHSQHSTKLSLYRHIQFGGVCEFYFHCELWWKSVKFSRSKVHNVSGWHRSGDLHDNPDGGHSGSGDVQGEKMLHKL